VEVLGNDAQGAAGAGGGAVLDLRTANTANGTANTGRWVWWNFKWISSWKWWDLV